MNTLPVEYGKCPCGYKGKMRVRMVYAGCHADSHGPAEKPYYEINCPKCKRFQIGVDDGE